MSTHDDGPQGMLSGKNYGRLYGCGLRTLDRYSERTPKARKQRAVTVVTHVSRSRLYRTPGSIPGGLRRAMEKANG